MCIFLIHLLTYMFGKKELFSKLLFVFHLIFVVETNKKFIILTSIKGLEKSQQDWLEQLLSSCLKNYLL